MSMRSIKTADGEVYSGYPSEFVEYGDYIEHHGYRDITKIYKRAIVRDSTNSQEGWSEIFPLMMILLILIVGIIIVMPPVDADDGGNFESAPVPVEHVQPGIKHTKGR